MDKKSFLDYISNLMKISLTLLGVSTSLLIPLFLGFLFQNSLILDLTSMQINYLNRILQFITISIFIFGFSFLISLIFHMILSLFKKKIKSNYAKKLIISLVLLNFAGTTLLFFALIYFYFFTLQISELFIAAIIILTIAIVLVIIIFSILLVESQEK